jgi:hypothetical protein
MDSGKKRKNNRKQGLKMLRKPRRHKMIERPPKEKRHYYVG